jgi:predicted transcriptional regulator
MKNLEKASSLPDSDIWPEILNIADKYNTALTIASLFALKSIKNKFGSKFLDILNSKDDKKLDKFLSGITLDGKKLGITSKKLINEIGNLINQKYNFGIDIKDLALNKYIDEHVAELVVQISETTRENINSLVKTGWKNQINPEKLAKNIKNSGIGLDYNRQLSLEKYRKALIKEGLSENQIDKLCIKKYNQLLLDRGRTIARTEAINLANEGSRVMYEQSAKQNPIISDNYELEWILTPDDRLCDKCRAMKGKRSSFTGTFEGGLRRPALHPRCRCAIVCVRKK